MSTKTKVAKPAINRIEDIFPLTIISTRYDHKFVIFNAHHDAKFIDPVFEDKKVVKDLIGWLEKNVKCTFGVGNTIDEAFSDYKVRDEDPRTF